jgi:hypothetical protein
MDTPTSPEDSFVLLKAREVTRPSLVAGLAGIFMGSTLAVYRGAPVSLYAVPMGFNFTLISASILTVEKAAAACTGQSSPGTFGLGGFFGGGFMSGVHAGSRGVVAGGLVFGILCGSSRLVWESISYEDFARFVN